jgi:hypothetical protein
MKKLSEADLTYYPPKTTRGLFDRMKIVLTADLEDPLIGQHAVNLLKTAKKWGFKFQHPAKECPECAACLFFSLMSACSCEESDYRH